MKNFVIIISILVLLICVTFFMNFSIKNKNIIRETYKMVKLDSIDQVYMIYAEKNDSIFKILSKKEQTPNCQTLEVGKLYELDIVSMFLPEEFHVKMRSSGIKFNNVLIELERDSIVGDLFTSVNIEGKCYINN